MNFISQQTKKESDVRAYFASYPRFLNPRDFQQELDALCGAFPAVAPLLIQVALQNTLSLDGVRVDGGFVDGDLQYLKDLFKYVAEHNPNETQNAKFLDAANALRQDCEAQIFNKKLSVAERQQRVNLLRYVVEFIGLNGRQISREMLLELAGEADKYDAEQQPDKQLLTTQAIDSRSGAFKHKFIVKGASAVCVLIDVTPACIEALKKALDEMCSVKLLAMLHLSLRHVLNELDRRISEGNVAPAVLSTLQKKKQLALLHMNPQEEELETHETLRRFTEIQKPTAEVLERYYAVLLKAKDAEQAFWTQTENFAVSEDVATRLEALRFFQRKQYWSSGLISRLSDVDLEVRKTCVELCAANINADDFPLQKLASTYMEFGAETALLSALRQDVFLERHDSLQGVLDRRGVAVRLISELETKLQEAKPPDGKNSQKKAAQVAGLQSSVADELARLYAFCSIEAVKGERCIPQHLIPALQQEFEKHALFFLRIGALQQFSPDELTWVAENLVRFDVGERVCGALLLELQTRTRPLRLPMAPLLSALFQTGPGDDIDAVSVCDDMHAYQCDVAFEFYSSMIRTITQCNPMGKDLLAQQFQNAETSPKEFAQFTKTYKAAENFCELRFRAACSLLPQVKDAGNLVEHALKAKGFAELRVFLPILENLCMVDDTNRAIYVYQDLLQQQYRQIPLGCEEDEELLQRRVIIAEQILRMLGNQRLEAMLTLKTLGVLATELSLQTLVQYRLPASFKDCTTMFAVTAPRAKTQLHKLFPIAVMLNTFNPKIIKEATVNQIRQQLEQLAAQCVPQNAVRRSPDFAVYYLGFYMARLLEVKRDAPIQAVCAAYGPYVSDNKAVSSYTGVFQRHHISSNQDVTMNVRKALNEQFESNTQQQAVFPAALFVDETQ